MSNLLTLLDEIRNYSETIEVSFVHQNLQEFNDLPLECVTVQEYVGGWNIKTEKIFRADSLEKCLEDALAWLRDDNKKLENHLCSSEQYYAEPDQIRHD